MLRLISDLLQDVVSALRQMRRSPRFVLLVAPVLALALTGVTSTYAIIDSVFLKPLPYGDSKRLIRVGHNHPLRGHIFGGFALADFQDLKSRTTTLDDVAAYVYWPGQTSVNAVINGNPRQVETAYVSPGFFQTLATQARIGQALSKAGTDTTGVIVISHGIWVNAFQSKQDIVGTSISVAGQGKTIVGVMPDYFDFPSPNVGFWMPLSAIGADQMALPRQFKWLDVIANVRNDVRIDQAEEQTSAILEAIAQNYPKENKGFNRAHLQTVLSALVGTDRKWIDAMFGATLLLLSVAYANLGSMLLARTLQNTRDLAICSALGASALRIAGQNVLLSLLITLLAVIIGIIWAEVLIATLIHGQVIPIVRAQEIEISLPVIAIVLGGSLCVALLAALVPALYILRTAPAKSLSEAAVSPTKMLSASALVAVQVALLFAISYNATSILLTVKRLADVDLGIRPDRVLAIGLRLEGPGFEDQELASLTLQKIVESIRQTSIVRDVAISKGSPLGTTGERYGIRIGDGDGGWVNPDWGFAYVTANYFDLLGIRVLSGRVFTGHEERTTPRDPIPLVVNRAFVAAYFNGEDVLFKELRTGLGGNARIIGVVENVYHTGPQAEPKPAMYVPNHLFFRSTATLLVQASAETSDVITAIRSAVSKVRPDIALGATEWLTDSEARLTFNHRVLRNVLMLFSAIGGVVVSMGIFSLLSMTFSSRSRELAIRRALGSSDGKLYLILLRRAVLLAGAGLAMGAPILLVMPNVLSNFTGVIHGFDLYAFVSSTILIASLVLVAALHPAFRVVTREATDVLRGK